MVELLESTFPMPVTVEADVVRLVKKARPSGTGAVLYVPKDWDGHTVVAVKLG